MSMTPTKAKLLGGIVAILGFGIALVSLLELLPQANEPFSLALWFPVGIGIAVMVAGGAIVFYQLNREPKTYDQLLSSRRGGYVLIVGGILVMGWGVSQSLVTLSGLWNCYVVKTVSSCADPSWFQSEFGNEEMIILYGIAFILVGLISVFWAKRKLSRLPYLPQRV